MAKITKVSTTAGEHAARQVAAELRVLGLDAVAEDAQAPWVWVVTVTYAEGMHMDDYLARLETIEGMITNFRSRIV